jgi:hypothetical protein
MLECPLLTRSGHPAKALIDAGRINRLRPKAIGKEGHIAEADGMYSKSNARSAGDTTDRKSVV